MTTDLIPCNPAGNLVAPALFLPDEKAAERFFDSFASNIRNRNTRRAYYKAAGRFAEWAKGRGLDQLARIKPIHVAAYIEELQAELSKPTVKQHLAALRMLFDWLVIGHIMDVNPAHSVRGPKFSQRKGKTPVLTAEEARTLLDAIDDGSVLGLRDRALIALMVFTFARIGAAVGMKVEDYFIQGRRGWVRLHEKGGKRHDVPANHKLDEYLEAYISGAMIGSDPKGFLFRTAKGRAGELSETPMRQADAYRMIRKRAEAAGIKTKIGNHTFRATGITAYLKNGGRLEVAQQIAAHESSRTTGLYDRRGDDVSLDEVERIAI
jgi:site-specific recombinase XerD